MITSLLVAATLGCPVMCADEVRPMTAEPTYSVCETNLPNAPTRYSIEYVMPGLHDTNDLDPRGVAFCAPLSNPEGAVLADITEDGYARYQASYVRANLSAPEPFWYVD